MLGGISYIVNSLPPLNQLQSAIHMFNNGGAAIHPIQLEIEDEQLEEWRKKMQAIKLKDEA
jgi:hypothetical protein